MKSDAAIVIPVWNEEETIGRMLDSLRAQTVRSAEVILVDGGSQDGTVTRALECSASLPLRVLEAGPALPGRARNIGIEAAQHERIALVDCGGYANRDWLARLLARAEAGNAEVVWGRYDPLVSSRRQRWIAAVISPGLVDGTGGRWRGRSVASCLLAREAWRLAGGFPEHLRSGEDLVFFKRLAAAGVREACEPGALVHWQMPRDFRALFRRNRRYSASGLEGGFWKEWHLAVFRNWLLLGGLALLALADWRAAPLIGLVLAVRVARIFWRHRGDEAVGLRSGPVDAVGVTLALLVSDVATVCGAWDWWIGARMRRTGADRAVVAEGAEEREGA